MALLVDFVFVYDLIDRLMMRAMLLLIAMWNDPHPDQKSVALRDSQRFFFL
jgi:hypothetical protein